MSYVSYGELFSGQSAPRDIELTILTNNQGYATKVFSLDENGQLSKRSAANIYEGHAERRRHCKPGRASGPHCKNCPRTRLSASASPN